MINLLLMKDYYTSGPGYYLLNNKGVIDELLTIDARMTRSRNDILILITEVDRLTKIISELNKTL